VLKDATIAQLFSGGPHSIEHFFASEPTLFFASLIELISEKRTTFDCLVGNSCKDSQWDDDLTGLSGFRGWRVRHYC
jgi:hypothetical protein